MFSMVLVGSGSVSFDTDPDSGSRHFLIRIRIRIPRIQIRNTAVGWFTYFGNISGKQIFPQTPFKPVNQRPMWVSFIWKKIPILLVTMPLFHDPEMVLMGREGGGEAGIWFFCSFWYYFSFTAFAGKSTSTPRKIPKLSKIETPVNVTLSSYEQVRERNIQVSWMNVKKY